MKRRFPLFFVLFVTIAAVTLLLALFTQAGTETAVAFGGEREQAETTLPLSQTWGSERAIAGDTFALDEEGHALDSSGQAHIVYGLDHLYHAWFDGQWHTEVVDPAYGVGRNASLVIDAQDHLHVSYYDAFEKQLKYAYFDGSAWRKRIIADLGGSNFESADIDVDSGGRPHVVYNASEVVHTWYDGSSWQAEIAEGGAYHFNNGAVSFALDSNDRPHIAYGANHYQSSSYYSEVHYAHKAGDQWEVEKLVSIARSNTIFYLGASLALDSAGRPHISYNHCWSGCLTYAYWDGSQWQEETIDDGGSSPSLILTAEGKPMVAFNGDLGSSWPTLVAVREGGSWQVTEVAAESSTPSLAVNAAGQIALALDRDDTLWHTRLAGGTWQGPVAVDHSFMAGLGVDLAFRGNVPHLSYGSSDGIGYSTLVDGSWKRETVDAVDDIWSGTSLALEPATGMPCVAYQLHEAPEPTAVRVACREGGGWVAEWVDTAPYRGNLPAVSLAFGPSPTQTLYLAYAVSGSGWSEIRLAEATASGWTTETVASGGASYATGVVHPRLQVSAGGEPQISYFDRDLQRVVYATRDQSDSWQRVALPATSWREEHDFSLDGNGVPHIVWNLSSHYAHFWLSGSEWVSDTLASGTSGSLSEVSLVLDEGDRPSVAYGVYGGADAGIHYATKQGSGWEQTAIDKRGVLEDPVLALDEAALPYVAYYDSSNGDLKFGWQERTATVPAGGGTLEAFGTATLAFPAGAFTDTVVISMTLVQPFDSAPTTGLFYDLEASWAGSGQPAALAPNATYTVTIHYDEAAIPAGVLESSLALYYWDGSEWVMEPSSQVDTEANILSAQPDHFSVWGALFLNSERLYLPLLVR